MKRILFVDDEKNVLDGIKRMLYSCRSEWEMHFVESGSGALAALRKTSFDVIVSDLRMPQMDGAELLGQVRTLYPGTARVILSGYSDVELTARAVPVAYRVLTKPCDAKKLKATLHQILTLQSVMCSDALRSVIGQLGELPSLSNTYVALNRALHDSEPSISAVTHLVEQDLGMTAKILQLVNSGFFGLAHDAPSLLHAVSYLGIDTIKTLTLYSETFRVFRPDPRIPRDFCETLQRQSQRAASIIGLLPLSKSVYQSATVAALLHDVGKLIIASSMPQQFLEIQAEMRATNMSEAEAEESLLGTTHAEIGAYLLGLWGIDSNIVEAIAHHENPTRVPHDGIDCCVAVYLADLIMRETEDHPDDADGDRLSDRDRQTLVRLGMIEEFPKLKAKVAASFPVLSLQ